MPCSVLFVAGKPTLGKEITSILTEPVFATCEVSDFYEAMSTLDRERADIVIMNIDLPLMDGWEACHWLHQTFGIPIILLGRESGGFAWPQAVKAGADFYMQVPFGNLELSARVKAILRRYNPDI